MKFMFYIIVIVLFVTPSFSAIKYECNKQCVVDVDPKTQQLTNNLICYLSNKNATMPITALDVFEVDDTLEKVLPKSRNRNS